MFSEFLFVWICLQHPLEKPTENHASTNRGHSKQSACKNPQIYESSQSMIARYPSFQSPPLGPWLAPLWFQGWFRDVFNKNRYQWRVEIIRTSARSYVSRNSLFAQEEQPGWRRGSHAGRAGKCHRVFPEKHFCPQAKEEKIIPGSWRVDSRER